ncbi:MAG: LytTR family DNA-binding domain-containing protein [Cytophagales bacterium]|nr:LytTR family DNA-binding domain-containing protein [Cytophagales bacterium]
MDVLSMVKKQLNTREWLLALTSGGFMFVVLYLYNAFNIQTGTSYSGHSLLFRSICFGLITFLSVGAQEWWIRQRLIIDSRKKRAIWYAIEILVTAHLVYLLFNYFWAWKEWYWISYGLMMIEVPMVLVIPISVVSILFKEPKTELDLLVLKAEGGKVSLAIKPQDLLFIKAEENYVNIHHLINGQVEKQLIRKTMKEILQELRDQPNMVRCHRSYLINRTKILRLVQSPKKLELDLGFNSIIPVSKTYQEEVLKSVEE